VSKPLRTGTLGLIIGAATGFALGVLFAPEEGKKLRRKLAYQLEHLGESVADLIDQTLGEHKESGEAKKDSESLVENARQKASVIRHDIDALLDEMRSHPSES
jgi:gas vesicle protein